MMGHQSLFSFVAIEACNIFTLHKEDVKELSWSNIEIIDILQTLKAKML